LRRDPAIEVNVPRNPALFFRTSEEVIARERERQAILLPSVEDDARRVRDRFLLRFEPDQFVNRTLTERELRAEVVLVSGRDIRVREESSPDALFDRDDLEISPPNSVPALDLDGPVNDRDRAPLLRRRKTEVPEPARLRGIELRLRREELADDRRC
jgi:hypothetical protein